MVSHGAEAPHAGTYRGVITPGHVAQDTHGQLFAHVADRRVRQVVRELVKPPDQCVLDAAQLAEELPRVLTMGGAVSPPAAVRFSIREHVWQREPPVNQVRGELHSGLNGALLLLPCMRGCFRQGSRARSVDQYPAPGSVTLV